MLNFLKKLFQAFFRWDIEPSSKEELGKAQAIVGLAFGGRDYGEDPVNLNLATVIRDLDFDYALPWILQWEIADLLPKYPGIHIIREHRIPGKYLDTREGLLQVKEICDNCGWETILLVAHPKHVIRVAKMAEKIGLKVAIAKTPEVYDHKSKQWWTKGYKRFMIREIPGRIISLVMGWM